jgi:hypothetical protein
MGFRASARREHRDRRNQPDTRHTAAIDSPRRDLGGQTVYRGYVVAGVTLEATADLNRSP